MKVFEFLKEGTIGKTFTLEDNADLIRTHCSKYLKEIGDISDHCLFRGSNNAELLSRVYDKEIKSSQKAKFTRLYRPSKRIPADMGKEYSKAIDLWFKKTHGILPRSQAVFATPLYYMARGYGNVYLFFPIGNYEYVYSMKYGDLYYSLNKFLRHNSPQEHSRGSMAVSQESIDKFLEQGDWHINEGLRDIIKQNQSYGTTDNNKIEIAILCDSYYIMGCTPGYSERKFFLEGVQEALYK